MILEHVRDAGREPLGERDVQELVGAVGVRAGAEQSRHHELRAGVFLAQQVHEGDRAALAHESRAVSATGGGVDLC